MTRGRRFRSSIRRIATSARVYFQNPFAVIGTVLIVAFALMVVAHPVLMATLWNNDARVYDPVTGYDAPIVELVVVESVTDSGSEISLVDARSGVDITSTIGDVVEKRVQPAPPSGTHFLGTDPLGRDVLSMVLAGAWPTFVVGITAALVTAVVGMTSAALSVTLGGMVDRALSGLSDVLLLMPAPLAMIIVGGLGESLSPAQFGVFYGLLAGAGTAAVTIRSHGRAVMQHAFIDAARVAGAGTARIGFRHLVPHLVPLAAATTVTAVVGAVVAHGFAAWLSFGDDLLNWGAMMFIAIGFLQLQGAVPWNVLLAGAGAISLFCAAFYLVSLGLRDVAFPPDGRPSGWATAVGRAVPRRVEP